MAQTVSIDDGQLTIDDFAYSPFGEVLSCGNTNDLFFGYNGEEYNPVTGLVYLRARYYNVETGTFITEDSYLGDDDNISSQNRYAYGEGDPVNHIDPTGHFTSLITQQAGWAADYWSGKFDSYAAGQITKQTNATGARSSYDYTISNGTANSYAQKGANAARGLCASYNCVPGEQVEKAIADMEQKITDAQKSANERIKSIRDNNVGEWDNSPDNPKNKPKKETENVGSSNGSGGENGNGMISDKSKPQLKIIHTGIQAPDRSVLVDNHTYSEKNATVPEWFSSLWWWTKGGLAEFVGLWPDGMAAYNHYRKGSGDDLSVNLTRAYNQDSEIKAFFQIIMDLVREDVVTCFNSLPGIRPKDSFLNTLYFSSDFINTDTVNPTYRYYPTTRNWQLALGGFSAWTFGKMTSDGLRYDVNLTIMVMDWYNFDPGKTAIGLQTPDSVNFRWEELKWAKPFFSVGSFNRHISWSKTF